MSSTPMTAPAPDELVRLRAYLRTERRHIVATYISRLKDANNPLAREPRMDIEAAAFGVLDSALRHSQPDLLNLGEPIGIRRADQRIPPSASTNAALTLFNVVADQTVQYAAEHNVSPGACAQIYFDMHHAILRQVTSAALPYTSALLRKLSSAHHQERRRIARNLHDHIAHAVAICMQQIDLRELALERNDPDEAQRRMDLLRESLKDADDLIHDLASEIGHTQTDDGFMVAMHRMIDLRGASTVAITATNTEELESAAPWILEEFFVAVREGISNALKHADAERIDVTVAVLDGQARVQIEDNGKGMDLADWDQTSAGKGLGSLRERIGLLGGKASIESTPGAGTTLDLRVPLMK